VIGHRALRLARVAPVNRIDNVKTAMMQGAGAWE